MGYGITHIQFGGRHTTCKSKGGNGNTSEKSEKCSRKYIATNVKTGKVVVSGSSRDLSNHKMINLCIKNISTYAHRKAIHGDLRIEFDES